MLELDKIHCGDNCDLLGKLPRECIDLVVTSPPYDDLRTYGGHSWDFFGVAWQLKRVLKPGGVIVWVVADATKDGSETGSSMEQALHFKRLGLNLHDTMVYASDKPPQNGNRYEQQWEFVFVFSVGTPKSWNLIREDARRAGHLTGKYYKADGAMKDAYNPGATGADRVRGNIWWYPTGRVGDARGLHPAMFPFDMARDHIATWSNAGDLVLDPFSGSGTTAKAAKELGRRFLGLEINPEYCAIAERRIAQQVFEYGTEMIETKEYTDGTTATGTAPLPILSPRQQDAADARRLIVDIESLMGGSNGPSIQLRGIVDRLATYNVVIQGPPAGGPAGMESSTT